MLRRHIKPGHRVIILGAGPTGLGAAWRLRELGHSSFQLFDRSAQVGGLATSFRDQHGFTWDIGGHIHVSHYPYFDAMLEAVLPGGWLHHQRDGRVHVGDRFIPYPFQSNIDQLDSADRWRCIAGLLAENGRQHAPPENLAAWLEQTYGTGICDLFMQPFNTKAWAWPLAQMDYRWLRAWASPKDGALAAGVDLTATLAKSLKSAPDHPEVQNPAQQGTFPYPTCGGTGALWQAVAAQIGADHIELAAEIAHIDWRNKLVEFANGRTVDYDVLISTIPLDRVIALAELHELSALARQLQHAAVHIVGIGAAGPAPPHLAGMRWLYFAAPDIPFHRATVLSSYAPDLVPRHAPHWSVMTETSSSPHKPIDSACLLDDTCDALRRVGILRPHDQVVSQWTFTSDYGYPIPTLGRDEALHELHAALQPLDIYSRGRFGGWKYEVSNQDQGFMQGVELVNRLLLGIHEVTYWFPHVANDRAYYHTG